MTDLWSASLITWKSFETQNVWFVCYKQLKKYLPNYKWELAVIPTYHWCFKTGWKCNSKRDQNHSK